MSEQSSSASSLKPHYLDAAIAMIPNSSALLADFLSKFGDVGSEAAMRREAIYHDWPLLPHECLILGFWRSYSARAFCDRRIMLLESVLDKLSGIEAHRDLAPALLGDSAAAISAALKLMPIQEPNRQGDLVMSAVLRAAIHGCHAAALVLSHVLGRLQLEESSSARLAASWSNFHQMPADAARWSND